jgi:hypothetical protein
VNLARLLEAPQSPRHEYSLGSAYRGVSDE